MNFSPEHYTPIRVTIHRWKRIPGLAGYVACTDGRIASTKRGPMRILTPRLNNRGYWRVKIAGRWRFAHRLVLETFTGPAPQDHEADHIDFQPARNAASNLRWLPTGINRRRKRTNARLFA